MDQYLDDVQILFSVRIYSIKESENRTVVNLKIVTAHKIILKTNKKSRLEFFGKGINEHLLKAIFNTELDYDFDALVYNFSISHPVKEFRIYFEINSQILYYSEDFQVEDLINNKNKELVFFNFDLKFQN